MQCNTVSGAGQWQPAAAPSEPGGHEVESSICYSYCAAKVCVVA
jgi:hypothetical protein